jgi:hypothetical protein
MRSMRRAGGKIIAESISHRPEQEQERVNVDFPVVDTMERDILNLYNIKVYSNGDAYETNIKH